MIMIINILMTRGAVFADSARFDRCAQLWLHALGLRFVVVVVDDDFVVVAEVHDGDVITVMIDPIKALFQARQSVASDKRSSSICPSILSDDQGEKSILIMLQFLDTLFKNTLYMYFHSLYEKCFTSPVFFCSHLVGFACMKTKCETNLDKLTSSHWLHKKCNPLRLWRNLKLLPTLL